MNTLGVLLVVVFIIMTASSFYFWLKGQKILFKYITWKEALMKPFGIRNKIPDNEWKLFKKFSKYQAMCFFGGILLTIFLFVLQWTFHLFITNP